MYMYVYVHECKQKSYKRNYILPSVASASREAPLPRPLDQGALSLAHPRPGRPRAVSTPVHLCRAMESKSILFQGAVTRANKGDNEMQTSSVLQSHYCSGLNVLITTVIILQCKQCHDYVSNNSCPTDKLLTHMDLHLISLYL